MRAYTHTHTQMPFHWQLDDLVKIVVHKVYHIERWSYIYGTQYNGPIELLQYTFGPFNFIDRCFWVLAITSHFAELINLLNHIMRIVSHFIGIVIMWYPASHTTCFAVSVHFHWHTILNLAYNTHCQCPFTFFTRGNRHRKPDFRSLFYSKKRVLLLLHFRNTKQKTANFRRNPKISKVNTDLQYPSIKFW